MRASLAASATMATLGWARASGRLIQSPVGVSCLTKCAMAARAPWISWTRRYWLPRLLMPSSLTLPPVECWRV